MYSTAKRLSALCIILAVINIIAAILLLMYFPQADLDFSTEVTAIMFLFSTAGVSIFISFGLRSLCQDLEMVYESNSESLHKMANQIKALEAKVK